MEHRKLDPSFMSHITIDLDIVKITTKAVCLKYGERLHVITFLEGERAKYIPMSESLLSYKRVRVGIDGTIIKFLKG